MAKPRMTIVVFAMIMVLVIAVAPRAEGLTCKDVVKSLLPCRTFLQQGGNIPGSCCNGVRALNNAAKPGPQRKTACQCVKTAAKAYKVNPQYAARVPNLCNVNIGYAISYSTDCNKVH
ncbi:Non-specific lipid-transfer protein [Sesamum alatum]|uniref:Non-specific lipid-transfer protein n=1 Tax=Sesamum alatum TaxID=300844 RepID=A0AAE1XWI5_9LAMI|nr:Non-specific lipid-transfer protein [Sesamum alatum]